MTHKSGLAAVLAAIEGKQPAGDAISRADHMSSVSTAATQAYGEGEQAARADASAETAGKVTLAVTGERARIKAIAFGENAKGREGLAAHFAFDTDMSAEAANAALAAAPKNDAKGSRLDALMPGNNPTLKDPGVSTEPDAGASLNGAVDKLVKQRGLAH